MACGSTAAPASSSTNPLGSAEFWVKSSAPVGASPSFTLEASFLTPGASSCTTTTLGACSVNPCFTPPQSTTKNATNAGEISLTSAMASGAIDPGSNGIYATQTFTDEVPWTTAGDTLTLSWAHFPGSATQPGSSFMVETPPYVTLTSNSAFATQGAGIAFTGDLTIAWTTSTPASSSDDVSVFLTSGSTLVGCDFAASSGTGVIPLAALQTLGAGAGSFDVHSKRSTTGKLTGTDGSVWVFGFNIDAYALTTYGVASGSITFQ
jgi:hypothetical protein